MAFVLIVFCVYVITNKTSGERLPPGPHPLPLLGTIYKHGINVNADTFIQLAKEYGPVYSIMGFRRYVIFNSYDAIREAMSRPNEFCHRGISDKYTYTLASENVLGIFARDYDVDLVRIRSDCVGIMRKLGMGKTVMEDHILQEISATVDILKATCNQPIDIKGLMNTSLGNIIVHFLFNKRYEHNDPEMASLLRHVEDSIKNAFHITLIDSVPAIRFISPFK